MSPPASLSPPGHSSALAPESGPGRSSSVTSAGIARSRGPLQAWLRTPPHGHGPAGEAGNAHNCDLGWLRTRKPAARLAGHTASPATATRPCPPRGGRSAAARDPRTGRAHLWVPTTRTPGRISGLIRLLLGASLPREGQTACESVRNKSAGVSTGCATFRASDCGRKRSQGLPRLPEEPQAAGPQPQQQDAAGQAAAQRAGLAREPRAVTVRSAIVSWRADGAVAVCDLAWPPRVAHSAPVAGEKVAGPPPLPGLRACSHPPDMRPTVGDPCGRGACAAGPDHARAWRGSRHRADPDPDAWPPAESSRPRGNRGGSGRGRVLVPDP